MAQLHFIIPGKPSGWQRAADVITKSGKRLRANPKAMVEGQKHIAWCAKAALRGAAPMTGPLRLEVLCVYGVPPSWPSWKQAAAARGLVWKTSTPDHDNLTKQIGDALNGLAFVDDAQIVRSSIAKRYGFPERTEVQLSRIDGLCDHSPQAAFQDWLMVNGNVAQIKAAARWLEAQRKATATPDLFANPCNTLERKG